MQPCMRGNLGLLEVLARNCFASTLDYIVMQMRKINSEEGYLTVLLAILNQRRYNARSDWLIVTEL